MNYDSKHYEFATTVASAPGKVVPPEGDRWTLVEMVASEKAPSSIIVWWTRQKKP